jgi:2-polyprenyl-3-methyl-5-hydroxy-6-metoxy-1,4-benzoquinol methylase
MTHAKDHYERLLGDVYAWSVSQRGNPFDRGAAWLARHGLDEATTYLDLGAGFGAHTLPLARAGKTVTAVDFDRTLLAGLAANLGDAAPRVTAVQGDFLDVLSAPTGGPWDVILCAGDTITHLPDVGAVQALLAGSARGLSPGGRLALQYRDSTAFSATGTARFLEVARDSTRIMHCLLEPIDDERLRVTDIVTETSADGPITRISDYVKLRLAPSRLVAMAGDAGLSLAARTDEAGMTTLVLQGP